MNARKLIAVCTLALTAALLAAAAPKKTAVPKNKAGMLLDARGLRADSPRTFQLYRKNVCVLTGWAGRAGLVAPGKYQLRVGFPAGHVAREIELRGGQKYDTASRKLAKIMAAKVAKPITDPKEACMIRCMECHDSSRMRPIARKSRSDIPALVRRMVAKRPTWIHKSEIAPITKYIQDNLARKPVHGYPKTQQSGRFPPHPRRRPPLLTRRLRRSCQLSIVNCVALASLGGYAAARHRQLSIVNRQL